MFHHIVRDKDGSDDGVVRQRFEEKPEVHPDFLIVDDGGQSGVDVGWTYRGGVLAPPITPALSKAQLLAFADDHVVGLFNMAKSYPANGATLLSLGVDPMTGATPSKTEIVEDANHSTVADHSELMRFLDAQTYPHLYSDENYTVWSMSREQLQEFLEACATYRAQVRAFLNASIIPGVLGGSITTRDQIENRLDWPK